MSEIRLLSRALRAPVFAVAAFRKGMAATISAMLAEWVFCTGSGQLISGALRRTASHCRVFNGRLNSLTFRVWFVKSVGPLLYL